MFEVRDVIEAIPYAVFIFDEDCRVVMVNSSALALGYSQDDLRGRHVSELALLDEQDRQRMCASLGEERFSIEGSITKRGGGVIPARIYVSRLDDGHLMVIRDVSDVKRAHEYILAMSQKDVEEIRKARDYAEKILRSMPVPVTLFDGDGVRKDVNAAFERSYGYTRREIAGTRLDAIYPDREVERVRAAFELCKEQGLSTCETIAKRKDGSRVPVLIRFSAMKGENAEILGVSVDVTPLKEAQEFADLLLRNVPVPLSLLDSEGKRMLVNDYFERLYKRSADEIVGSDLIDIYPKKHHRALMDAFDAAMAQGHASCEVEVMIEGRELMPVVVNFSSLDDPDGRRIVIGTATDVSELKEREMELKRVLDSLPAAVWRSDRDKRCTYINKEFTRLLGWTGDDLVGVRDDEAPYVCDERTDLCDRTWSEVMHEVWDLIDRGKRPEPFEIPLRTKDGRVVAHRAVEIPLDGGNVWASMDITTEKMAKKGNDRNI
jgi:PAS domain S-box-containing protein